MNNKKLAEIVLKDIYSKYGMKLTAPSAVWGDEVAEEVSNIFQAYGRKGSHRKFAEEFIKVFGHFDVESLAQKCKYKKEMVR